MFQCSLETNSISDVFTSILASLLPQTVNSNPSTRSHLNLNKHTHSICSHTHTYTSYIPSNMFTQCHKHSHTHLYSHVLTHTPPHIYPQTCSHTVTYTLTHTSIHTHSQTYTSHIPSNMFTHCHIYTHTHLYSHTLTHTHVPLHVWRGPRWLPGIFGRGRQANSVLWQVRMFLLKALFDLWLKKNRTSFRHLGSTVFPKLHTLMGSKENFTRTWGSQNTCFVICGDAGKDWGQEGKGAIEDEMVGWHHWLKFEQTLGDGEGQGSLACCSSWGHKESDTT